ncbi:restriction endonuclease subunit S [Flavobacterium caseinilyticum]|uniref:Type I restriction modification DNA specificity domain-containing protein n=1 Tax=Flavobacterium caseinilyticum TaxID=2541732 RepID=A0A4R5AV72_9FLAO|nr:restriction endonuclease subunit S [Flavobacterium caseinilyticum]TDD75829.1 hypothetical protein E0F89_09710 [Flavobacterium caseinilyticum]
MREDWVGCSFEEVVLSFKRGPFGGDLKKSIFVESGFKVYEQQHAINNDFSIGRYFVSEETYDKLKTCNVGPGDYIVSCSGTMGKIARLPEGSPLGIINQALLRIRINDTIIDHNYFVNFFRSKIFQDLILKDSRGSGMQNMAGLKEIKPIRLFIPPLPEQRAIVAKIEELFSSLDSGIADLKKAQAQLKIYRQAVLKKAFEGGLTKEWRAKQDNLPTPGELLEQIKKERKNHYKQQIEDWKKAVKSWEKNIDGGSKPSKPKKMESFEIIEQNGDLPILHLGEIVFQISIKKMPKESPNLPFIGMDCISKNTLKPSFTYTFKELKSAGNWFTKNHILYGRLRPYLNKIYRAEYEGVASGEFLILESISMINPDYLKLILHQQDFVRWSNNQASGDKPRVKYDQIALYYIKVPSIEEQQQIVQEIESRLSVCDKVEESIVESLEKSKALHQSILKKAFEGRLLNDQELAACKSAPDYEPASVLLKRIKEEKATGAKKAPVSKKRVKDKK